MIMIREIIKIDDEKCNGCGLCIPACPEGALQMIDGKARLVSDLMCDGLGACLGECPQAAITIEKREAEPYNETVAMKEIVRHGKNTVLAHLRHLLDHDEAEYFSEAMEYLYEVRESLEFDPDDLIDELETTEEAASACASGGCPGSAMKMFEVDQEKVEAAAITANAAPAPDMPSQLRQWPVQMHLVNPLAPYFQGADVLLAADCVAFSIGDFHQKFLKNHSLAIACPKLDQGKEIYIDKLTAMIENAKIKSLTVMIMEVPCCGGLLQMANMARSRASREIPLKMIRIGIKGDVLQEEDL